MRKIDALQRELMIIHGVRNREMAVQCYCPAYLKCGDGMVDVETSIKDEDGYTAGCRGITCIECWNKEVD